MLAELLSVSPEWSATFLLVLARLSAAVVVLPLFGARGVPPQAKIGLALLLSLVVLPLQSTPLPAPPADLLSFAVAVGSEVLVGITMGLAVALVFHAMEMAGSMVGVQMGFDMGAVLDPITGAQSGALAQFYRMLATLIFFAVNGHYLVISGLLHSFSVAPPGTADLSLIAGDRAGAFLGALVVMALRVALPVAGTLMLTDLAMGLAARMVPQMPVLIVGFPVKIGVGLFVLALSVPLVAAFVAGVFRGPMMDVNRFLVP